jgi:hypothetical protein
MSGEIDDYAEAAANKLAFAGACRAELDGLRRGEEDERPAIQRAFEGLISSGTSAGDQLSAALAVRAGVRLRRNTPAELLRRLADSDDELVALFRQWAESAVVRDARRRRNLAIHAHYVKRPYRQELTWLLEPVTVDGQPSPYEGPLDVHSYAAAYAESLDLLERVITGLPDVDADVSA